MEVSIKLGLGKSVEFDDDGQEFRDEPAADCASDNAS